MLAILLTSAVSTPSTKEAIQSSQEKIREAEKVFAERVANAIDRDERRLHQCQLTIGNGTNERTEPINSYEFVGVVSDYHFSPIEGWLIGICNGHFWTRPSIISYFLLPFQTVRRLSLPPTAGRWTSDGIDGVFVFRFAKRTRVSRIVFSPFVSAPCNLRDTAVEGFDGESWIPLGNFTAPNGDSRYREFTLDDTHELKGSRIFASNNYGDRSQTCLNEVRFFVRSPE
jgi:hypothetical protein